uniref:Uncharacterized protein n=1 Tax=viral metagenome TaxID=1070528 RepID=A0A6C0BE17_9ZZZZ
MAINNIFIIYENLNMYKNVCNKIYYRILY